MLQPIESDFDTLAKNTSPNKKGFFDETQNLLMVAIGAGLAVIILILLVTLIFCCLRRSKSNGGGRSKRAGYTPGKRTDVKPPPDLWIDHQPHDSQDGSRRRSKCSALISRTASNAVDQSSPNGSMHDMKMYAQSPDHGHQYHSLAGRCTRFLYGRA